MFFPLAPFHVFAMGRQTASSPGTRNALACPGHIDMRASRSALRAEGRRTEASSMELATLVDVTPGRRTAGRLPGGGAKCSVQKLMRFRVASGNDRLQ